MQTPASIQLATGSTMSTSPPAVPPPPPTPSARSFKTERMTIPGYDTIKMLGKGTYGRVFVVRNANGDEYAMKVMRLFPDDVERIKTEIECLCSLCHDNLLRAVTEKPFYIMRDNRYLAIITERFDITLKTALAAGLSRTQRDLVMACVCNGVAFMHSVTLMHRDIKPDNVLVNLDLGRVVVADFGLVGTASNESSYVVTRWYRAPELLYKHVYSCAIDIWAIGCMYGELFELTPLFRGSDDSDQITRIAARLCTSTSVHASYRAMCALKRDAALHGNGGWQLDELDLFRSMLELDYAQRASAESLATDFGRRACRARAKGAQSATPSLDVIQVACGLLSSR
jgi:serine/threonine protein kinase